MRETPEGTPYVGPYREASLERGALFLGFRYMNGKGFHKLNYIKGGEILHLGLWKGPTGLTYKFYGFKKWQLKGMQSSKQGVWRGNICQQKAYERGTFFLEYGK